MGRSGTPAPTMPRADALGYLKNTASWRQFVELRLLKFGCVSSSIECWGEGDAFAVVRTTWGVGGQAVLCRK